MNNVDTRAPFFPRSKTAQSEVQQTRTNPAVNRNSYDRIQEIENKTSSHAKVTIPDEIRDFSRIKRAATMAPEVDNTDKIAMLKAQIQAGTYQPNYDAIADKILESEY